MAEDDVLPSDPRDEALARALAVEPLDDLTRRRLVSGALAAAHDGTDEMEPPAQGTARARVLGIAAAAVAFVVLGVAALALPGGDTTDVASRAPQARAGQAAPAPTTSAPTAAPESQGTALGPTVAAAGQSTGAASDSSALAGEPAPIPGVATLGDLGELSVPGTRSRVLTDAEPVAADQRPLSRRVSFRSCPERGVTAVAAGLGTLDGAPALVVVSRRDDGTLRVRVLDGSTCTLRPLP
jgi:hypothetical protein